MSEKISINVEVLGLNISHNFMVPNDMSVSKVTNLILGILEDEYLGVTSNKLVSHMPVSYTHLTLPTSLRV